MKRLLIRLSAVGSILVLGVLAIAQTQFKADKGDALAGEQGVQAASSAPDAQADSTPRPIPDMDDAPTELVAPTAASFRSAADPGAPAESVNPTQPSRFHNDPPTNNSGLSDKNNRLPETAEPPSYAAEPPSYDGGGSRYGESGAVRTVGVESPDESEAAPRSDARFATDSEPPLEEVEGAANAVAIGNETGAPPPSSPLPPSSQLPPSSALPAAYQLPAGGAEQPAASQYAFADDPSPSETGQPGPTGTGQPSTGSGNAAQATLGAGVSGIAAVAAVAARGGAYAPPPPTPFTSQDNRPTRYGSEPASEPPKPARDAPPITTPPITTPPITNVSETPRAGGYGGAPVADSTSPTAGTYAPVADPTLPRASSPVPGDRMPSEVGGVANAGGMGGSGQPGERQLEGVQTPTLTIEKIAPPEIQVNRPASFQVRVRNIGQTAAHHVVVTDQVPRGTRLVRASPEFVRAPDGSITWQLGTLAAGQEATITMELMPLEEGEIGSVAQVSFRAEASVRTICTQPKLVLKHTTPPRVLIGGNVVLSISLKNEGSGAATGVVIEEDVPEGLSHAAGRELEYEIGTLRPGETKTLDLPLQAARAGNVVNRLVARAEGEILVSDELEVFVVAPQMKLEVDGPTKRYLERQATYTIEIANDGTATAKDLEIAAHLPRGLKFVSTNNQGRYDPQRHTVIWSLAELPSDARGSVELTVLPVEIGQHKLRVQGKGAMDLADTQEYEISVEGLAALSFQVSDVADPIPVGSETVYEIRISSTGTKPSTNVRLTATLPAQMLPLSGEGPTRVVVQGQQIIAEPIASLAPQGDALYKIRVRGEDAGDQRIRFQVVSDELSAPILKEESTRVYSDR